MKGAVTVWIRGDRKLVKELKRIALEDNKGLQDLITDALIAQFDGRIRNVERYYRPSDVGNNQDVLGKDNG